MSYLAFKGAEFVPGLLAFFSVSQGAGQERDPLRSFKQEVINTGDRDNAFTLNVFLSYLVIKEQ